MYQAFETRESTVSLTCLRRLRRRPDAGYRVGQGLQALRESNARPHAGEFAGEFDILRLTPIPAFRLQPVPIHIQGA